MECLGFLFTGLCSIVQMARPHQDSILSKQKHIQWVGKIIDRINNYIIHCKQIKISLECLFDLFVCFLPTPSWYLLIFKTKLRGIFYNSLNSVLMIISSKVMFTLKVKDFFWNQSPWISYGNTDCEMSLCCWREHWSLLVLGEMFIPIRS